MITEENLILKAGLRAVFQKLQSTSAFEREQIFERADAVTSNDSLRYLGTLNTALMPLLALVTIHHSLRPQWRKIKAGRGTSGIQSFRTTQNRMMICNMWRDDWNTPLFDLGGQTPFRGDVRNTTSRLGLPLLSRKFILLPRLP
jgi:hypothetical protein